MPTFAENHPIVKIVGFPTKYTIVWSKIYFELADYLICKFNYSCAYFRSTLYYYDLKSAKLTVLGAENMAIDLPRFSPNMEKLIFVQRKAGGTHQGCVQLCTVSEKLIWLQFCSLIVNREILYIFCILARLGKQGGSGCCRYGANSAR